MPGKHVAVLMGGWSAEREVSLRSGKACADALETRG
ncbi:MAG TPA: D-alanine--D-alanine ligase, partial [Xanthobacteraceae bacterium]|nr:D-alanine--D-alanine ligase [Xanthobacteraceae bacterium]